MALSDCPKCWDTPCECGEYWKDASDMRLVEYIKNIFNYHSKEDAERILKESIIVIKNRKEIQ